MEDISIIDWILKYKIKSEKGDPLDFTQHLFQWDIFLDQSQYICVKKAAQVGMTLLEFIKTIYDAHKYKMDVIYTLPTDEDISIKVGGTFNRIIAHNPILLEYTKDKDSVEQKSVGDSIVYFRGTFTKKAATQIPADRLVHDEKDSSKQDVVKEYEARLQHSKFKQKHVFSHPSTPNSGVDVEWNESDQKEWFITCPHCSHEQYLSWDTGKIENMSVNVDKEIFVCKLCRKELFDKDRAVGVWRARVFRDKEGNIIKRKYSGYHVSLLMAPWVSAKDILAKYKDPEITEEFFYNKVLGLEYIGAGNKLTFGHIAQNITSTILTPADNELVIIGADTGLKIDYVMGSAKGMFYQGDATGYGELDAHMRRWPKAICIMDGGGDLIGSREFQNRWKNRVWLCYFGGDKKGTDEPAWNDEENKVNVDRNKWIQKVVDQFRLQRIPLQGSEADWYDYWLDWNNLSRIKIVDATTGEFKGFKWVRSGRDHRALATVYFDVGVSKFKETLATFNAPTVQYSSNGIDVLPDGEAMFKPRFR